VSDRRVVDTARREFRDLAGRWPRAQSKLYEEPKKLVAHGLAEASNERVGKRPRTVYGITAEGPGDGPVVEFEQLLKVSFAEHGSKTDALSTLAAARAWAQERNSENLAAARAYAAEQGPFQHRAAQNMLAGTFLTDFYAMVAQWADWATALVEQWPENPAEAVPDSAAVEEILRRAEW
jgi:PadR family transcriptional regulator AphA